ncbi:hypothetical protein [Exiguobacterium sp. s22]|uniref:hypothetical protein n=1 Tax=Exiguobacterium sp. s22 TaxID=2751272 RepID=UPI001BEB714E|nr:hypothetical protein [Exiguobacterium sp. s22]
MTQTIEVSYDKCQSVNAVLALLGHKEPSLIDHRYGTQRYLTQTGEMVDIFDDFEEAVYAVSIYTK